MSSQPFFHGAVSSKRIIVFSLRRPPDNVWSHSCGYYSLLYLEFSTRSIFISHSWVKYRRFCLAFALDSFHHVTVLLGRSHFVQAPWVRGFMDLALLPPSIILVNGSVFLKNRIWPLRKQGVPNLDSLLAAENDQVHSNDKQDRVYSNPLLQFLSQQAFIL